MTTKEHEEFRTECEQKRTKCAQDRRIEFRWAVGLIATILLVIVGASIGWAFKTSSDGSVNSANIESNAQAIEHVETVISEDIQELRTEQRKDMSDIRQRLDKVIFILRPSLASGTLTFGSLRKIAPVSPPSVRLVAPWNSARAK